MRLSWQRILRSRDVKAYRFDKQMPVFRRHVLSPVSRQKIVSCNGEKVVHILCGNRALSETRTVVSLLSSCYLVRLLIHVELLSLFPFSLISYLPVSKTTLATVSLKAPGTFSHPHNAYRIFQFFLEYGSSSVIIVKRNTRTCFPDYHKYKYRIRQKKFPDLGGA